MLGTIRVPHDQGTRYSASEANHGSLNIGTDITRTVTIIVPGMPRYEHAVMPDGGLGTNDALTKKYHHLR